MAKELKDIGIVLKPSQFDNLPNLIINLIRWLKRRNKSIYFSINEEQRFSKDISPKTSKDFSFIEDRKLHTTMDLIISLGGDGTLLGVCRKIKATIPIFGVNLGHLGFITEYNKNDFYEKLNVVLSGRFTTIKKNMFSLSLYKKSKLLDKEFFFNDAVFTKNEIARMFTLSVETDEDHIFDLTGDGLILSSTYGSTAYSLAAGGPIVHPEVKAMILTPICPHSLTHRPLVLPDSYRVKIKVIERTSNVSITLDGQKCIELGSGHHAIIAREGRKSITLIKNLDRTYFHTLKEKFVHGRREAKSL